jgi:hypothetical protein
MTKIKVCNKTLNVEKGNVSFKFENGKDLLTGLDDMPVEMVRRLALHGLTQKVGDSYSGESDPMQAWMKAIAVVDMLEKGEWSGGRSGNGGVLAEALARQSGKALEECQEVIKGLTDKMKAQLRKALHLELAQIALEKANAKVDANPVDLGGLFDK